MKNLSIAKDVRQFIGEHFFFVKPEIYKVFNKRDVIFFVSKRYAYFRKNQERLSKMDSTAFMVENFEQDNWERLDLDKHLEYFVSEFRWFDDRGSKQEVKRAVKEIFENPSDFCQILPMTDQLKSLATGRRRRSILPAGSLAHESQETFNEIFQPGDTVYFNENKSNIVSPGLVVDQNENGNYRIIYFTNLSKDIIETKKTDINGWALASLSVNEFGKTPEMARRNSYV